MMRSGGCLCGQIRYRVEGEPLVVGTCHCADCRKESGAAFVHYAKWPLTGFSFEGELSRWQGRGFCGRCGGRLFNLQVETVEIRLGSLDDAPNGLAPVQEGWIRRREPWLAPVDGASLSPEDP